MALEAGIPSGEELAQLYILAHEYGHHVQNAASTVGDDNIQQSSGGFVNPESWTHGSSSQREFWFAQGYQNGVGACDTFAVAGSDL